jgi:hypothetical protein
LGKSEGQNCFWRRLGKKVRKAPSPASVSGAVLKLEVRANNDPLFEPPNYEGAKVLSDSSAFLAADREHYLETGFSLVAGQLPRITNVFLSTYLYLYGYVENTDVLV